MKARLAEPLGALRRVFANPNLRRIQVAWLGENLGYFSYFLAISVFAYDAGGAGAVGLAAVARMLPTALVTPFAAALADRYRRQRVMLASALGRALLLAATAFAIVVAAPAVAVIALAALAAVASAPFEPAKSALLPALAATPEELTAANLASSTVESVTLFVGPVIGGVLLGAAGPEAALLFSVGALLWSAWFVGRVDARGPERREGEPEPLGREAAAGFRAVAGDARLRLVVGLMAAQLLVFGAFTVLSVVLALDLLETGDAGLGYMNAALGVGAFVGAAGALGLVGGRRLARGLGLGVALWGAPLALAGLVVDEAAVLCLMAAMGLANTLVDVSGLSLLQRIAPEDVLARVFGVLETLALAAIAVGALLAPLLVGVLGDREALVATGALLPLLVLLSWPRLRALDGAAPAPSHALRLLQELPEFAPLGPIALEELAARLVLVRFSDGQAIVRQGEPGDRFYVVAEGTVEVAVDDRHVHSQGPGSHFGEIALLRDVPRTATVSAQGDVELYALERADFLDAVTGHPRSGAAAEAVIANRLARARPTGVPA